MFNDVEQRKAKYARLIEDGQKIEAFTSMPEWQWYVEHVLKPTIAEDTEKILKGQLESDKADWVMRGIVQGLQMIIDGTTGFINNMNTAKAAAKKLNEQIKEQGDV